MINLREQKGIFLSVEGPEFSGKSTLIQKLKESNLPLNLTVTKEPGGTDRGKILREWATNPQGAFVHNQTLRAMAFAMDRAIHIEEVILPHLQKGNLVISDRYIDSSFTLQGLIQGISIDKIKFLNCIAADETTNIKDILPIKTIFVDITEEEAIERSKKRGMENLLDKEFMPRFNDIRNAYLELARQDPERYIIFDGKGSIAEVFERFKDLILKIVKEQKPELIK